MLSTTIMTDGIKMLSSDELHQYFQRICASDTEIIRFLGSPLLDVLVAIHRLQVLHVHVSNEEMQDPARVNTEHPISPYFHDIFNKIVTQHQHGYCFDNNQLLRHVLITLGYDVTLYNAHIIRDNKPKDDAQHIILLVKLGEKEYLVDAGYGGVAPIPVVEFTLDTKQTSVEKAWKTTSASENKYIITSEKFKFDGKTEEDGFVVSHKYRLPDGGQKLWKPLYIFRKQVCNFKEFLEANDRVCRYEHTTPFKTRIFETAFEGDSVRKSITQDELHITVSGTTVLHKPVSSAEKYTKYLIKYFGHFKTRQIHERVEFGNKTVQPVSGKLG